MTTVTLRSEGPNQTTIGAGPLTLVFSYSTCVAFAVSGEGWCVSENVWSKTTARHINAATPKGVERVPNNLFEERLAKVLARLEFRPPVLTEEES